MVPVGQHGEQVCDKGVISPLSRGCQLTFLNPSIGLPRWASGRVQVCLAVLQPRRASVKLSCSHDNPDPREHRGTASGRRVTPPRRIPLNPRGSPQPTLPPRPQVGSGGSLPEPGANLPTGLAPGEPVQLPQQRLPSSSSLLRCPRGEKNSLEPAGTVPKFSFLAQYPGKTAKSSRESSLALV